MRLSEAFCFGWLSELRLLLGSVDFLESCEWRLLPLLLGSWSSLFSVWFPAWCDSSTSSWRWFLGEATHRREGSAPRLTSTCSEVREDSLELGKDRGSRRLDPARSRWSPGPNNLKTTGGGEVRDRLWVSAHLSSELELVIKGLCHHFLGVCVCVRVSVGPSNK